MSDRIERRIPFIEDDDAAHPHRVEDFRRAIATVAALPCDILLTPHPDASGFWGRISRRGAGVHPDLLINANACRDYAATATQNLDARLEQKQAFHR